MPILKAKGKKEGKNEVMKLQRKPFVFYVKHCGGGSIWVCASRHCRFVASLEYGGLADVSDEGWTDDFDSCLICHKVINKPKAWRT